MADSRKSTRRPVRHGSWIFVGANTPLIPCVLLDVSDSGARLKVDPATELPADFILVLSRDKRLNRRCRMIWRDEGMVGATFVTPKSIKRAAAPEPGVDMQAVKDQITDNKSKVAKAKSPTPAG
jgi:PilZ domain